MTFLPLGWLKKAHVSRATVSDVLKYIGPGLLVTVGFIDPGNWAANVAAGAGFGYTLLWMVTLGTLMLIVLQHNAAHLGIVTGLCLSEAANRHLPRALSSPLLISGTLAACATAMAELLGGGIALQMITGIPFRIGTAIIFMIVLWLVLGTSYRPLERYIIGFVSLIGLAFVFEVWLVDTEWGSAARGWITPAIPPGSLEIVMSVLGAVVMPHNLFLHSEIIQSRQWNLKGEGAMLHQLKYEFVDTLFSMGIGWAINSAMLIVAAATFYKHNIAVSELPQAERMLRPILGDSAAMVFALALLLAGIASSITAGMSGGSIVAGMSGEPYNSRDPHTRLGIVTTLGIGAVAAFFIPDPFSGLIFSQVLLSIQLPWTIFLLIHLTSSPTVMGPHANGPMGKAMLWSIAATVTGLNVMLLVELMS